MSKTSGLLLFVLAVLVAGGAYALYHLFVQTDPPRVEGRPFAMSGGFWTRDRDAAAPEAPDDDLLSLPYVSGSRPPQAVRGVTVYDAELAQGGLNLLTSAHAAVALLLDMEGKEVHRWTLERDRVWPQLADYGSDHARKYFRRVHLFENGDLLAIYEYTGVVRLNADSELLWAHQGWNHHDLDVDEEGRIFVLGFEDKAVPALREAPIMADNITVLGPDGDVLDVVEIADCLLASTYAELIELAQQHKSADVFHTNTVQVLDGAHAERSPAFARGNLLISMRNLGAIGVIDPQQRKLVWAAWGPWRMQHEPVLLANGNILLFDNRTQSMDETQSSGSSRILEFDPERREVVWEYAGTAERPFYSSLCGTACRLPNGNTLVTESDYGRAFELTPDKDIVWEFKNPHLTGPNDEFVALVPEVIRIPAIFPRWLR